MLYSACSKPLVSCVDNDYISLVSTGPSCHSSARSHLVDAPVSITTTTFLLQDVNKAFCIAHAGGVSMQTIRNSTVSSQGKPCLSHCKVKVNEKVVLPAALLQHLCCNTWFACHPHHKHSLKAEQQDHAQAVLLQFLQQLFIGSMTKLSVLSQASPREPSTVHALPVLPIFAGAHLCHGHTHLSRQQSWNTVGRQLIKTDAKSASAGKAAAVQAEFAKAGISAEVTQKILKQYKPYLNWDVKTKLRPALQSWLQELGTEQLSQQLQKVQRLLVCKPQECSEVHLWLSSQGINAERVQQAAPYIMTRDVGAMQSTFEALQQAASFSEAQMCALLHKHPVALAYGPERVLGTLQAVGTLLGTPMTSEGFRQVIIAAHPRLFQQSPATLRQLVTFFCQMYATGTHVVRTVLTSGVLVTSEAVMQTRAAKLQEQLGWDSKQLKQKLGAYPSILIKEPSTLARNVQEMQGAGFSQTQVWAMCTQHPDLLARKWTSNTCVEKLQFLTCLLGLTLDDIAARSYLLTRSVGGFLGPRVWFLYQTGAIEAPNTVTTSGLFGYIIYSKAAFGKRFRSPSAFPSMVFDSAFIDHWKQRWEFLRQHLKLSVETIAAHQDLLLVSLPDRLAPRWQLLSSIANEQAAFKAEDHLTALATLSDHDFAQDFRADGELNGTWQSSKAAVFCDFRSVPV